MFEPELFEKRQVSPGSDAQGVGVVSGVAEKRPVPQQGVTGIVTTAARGACFHVAWVEVWWQLEQENTGAECEKTEEENVSVYQPPASAVDSHKIIFLDHH